MCEFSGRPEDKFYRKLLWAIEFQLCVAQNGHELNTWVGVLIKVCNLTHVTIIFLTDMIAPKRNYNKLKHFIGLYIVYRKCIEVDTQDTKNIEIVCLDLGFENQ